MVSGFALIMGMLSLGECGICGECCETGECVTGECCKTGELVAGELCESGECVRGECGPFWPLALPCNLPNARLSGCAGREGFSSAGGSLVGTGGGGGECLGSSTLSCVCRGGGRIDGFGGSAGFALSPDASGVLVGLL